MDLKASGFYSDGACLHERPVTSGIDLVCTDCGLVLEVNPFGGLPQWDPKGLPDRPAKQPPGSQRFKEELAAAARKLGISLEPGLLSALASGQRPSGRLEHAAVARLYSHLRAEVPLEYILERLGASLRSVTPALRLEGVYEDEPLETVVGFGIRRSGAPREAREDCYRLLQAFPTHSRRHVVAAALAEWVGEEASAEALGLSERGVRIAMARSRE